MPYQVPIEQARADYPEFEFVAPLTPSEQKAAFHVRDHQGNNLCLKIIAPDFDIDRLNREIAALNLIHHPNVVELKQYTRSMVGGKLRHFIVEDFIPGSDLRDRIRPNVQMPLDNAIPLFASICDGLEALRLQKIVHRDLKPANIRVRPDGIPVIIDFGLARHLNLPALTATGQGAAIGTPLYFAPEQAEDGGSKANIDHRTDLFALGVMAYEAAVGQHPFFTPAMKFESQLREAICTSRDYLNVAAFTNLPPRLRLILSKLLEKERIKRPSAAGTVATLLRTFGRNGQ